MGCPKDLTLTDAPPAGRVFWGTFATEPFSGLDLVTMPSWPFSAPTNFDTLLHSFGLQSEVALLRTPTNGYPFFSTTDPGWFGWTDFYFWFAYPKTYGIPASITGLQFGWGNTSTIAASVIPYADPPAPLNQNVYGLSNWPGFGGTLNNGWYYVEFHVTDGFYGIDEDYYFFVFGAQWNLERVLCQPGGAGAYPADQASSPISRSRTSNISQIVISSVANWGAYSGYYFTISGASDSSFNIAQPGTQPTLDVAWTQWSYSNIGSNVGSTGDTGYTATFWQRDNVAFTNAVEYIVGGGLQDTTTLFVTI